MLMNNDYKGKSQKKAFPFIMFMNLIQDSIYSHSGLLATGQAEYY